MYKLRKNKCNIRLQYLIKLKINHHWVTEYSNIRIVDKFGVEDTVFCEVDIMHTTFYNCTSTHKLLQTAKFAHMNGHWKDYDSESNNGGCKL